MLQRERTSTGTAVGTLSWGQEFRILGCAAKRAVYEAVLRVAFSDGGFFLSAKSNSWWEAGYPRGDPYNKYDALNARREKHGRPIQTWESHVPYSRTITIVYILKKKERLTRSIQPTWRCPQTTCTWPVSSTELPSLASGATRFCLFWRHGWRSLNKPTRSKKDWQLYISRGIKRCVPQEGSVYSGPCLWLYVLSYKKILKPVYVPSERWVHFSSSIITENKFPALS